jgi:hypothetical protein
LESVTSPLFDIWYLLFLLCLGDLFLLLCLLFGIFYFSFVCHLVSLLLLCLLFDIFYFSSLCHLVSVTSPLFVIWYLLLLLCLGDLLLLLCLLFGIFNGVV